ncbi:MAG: P-loop NTPase fold protein [Blastocatellales bacterium]
MTKTEAKQFWAPIINDFQPLDSTWLGEIDKFYVDRSAGDPTNSALQLLKEGLLASLDRAKPYRALLTGHRGAGKSSELIRLAEELAEDFFVVRFDAELTLSPETTNHFDIILGMGIAVFATAQLKDMKPSKKLADDLLKSLSKFIQKYEDRKGFKLDLASLVKQVAVGIVNVSAVGVVTGGNPAALVAATAFQATKLELNVSDEHIRTLELLPNRIEVISALNKIIEWVQDECGKRVLMIVDGLDKVATPRARLLFADSSLLRDPMCALVYAAPIVFYYRAAAWQAEHIFDAYEMLPNVPVCQQPSREKNHLEPRELSPSGLEVMREVVARRLDKHGHSVDDVFTAEAMSMLAQMSGGVMRQLILRFNNAATYAKMMGRDKIDHELAHKSVMAHRKQLKTRLNADYRKALLAVLSERSLCGGGSQEAEDEMLTNDYLLSYRDENDAWFDVHPNALPLLRS